MSPASIIECWRVAKLLRDEFESLGTVAYPKTSGSKGLQVYLPLPATQSWEVVHAHARELAQRFELSHPDLVVSNMEKALRRGKVLIDWSQNNVSKTTVAPYSMRALPTATVSTPLSWDEVDRCEASENGEELSFDTNQVLERVKERGDLFGGLL